MKDYTISLFDGHDGIPCNSAEELSAKLLALSERLLGNPTLINIYAEDDRIAILGVGAFYSTLQCVDKVSGTSSRAVTDNCDGDDHEFTYQGEATFVQSMHSIPQHLAISGAVQWLCKRELLPGIPWRIREYPPRRS